MQPTPRQTSDGFTSVRILTNDTALIESNRQRVKTNEQIGREYSVLKRIFNERESRQGKRNDLEVTSVIRMTEVQKPSQVASDRLGVSRNTAHQAESVVKAIDSATERQDFSTADELRKTLNTSVKQAYKQVQAIPEYRPQPSPIKTTALIS